MALVCSLSMIARLAVLAFTAGLVVGLVLGHRAEVDPADADRTPATGTSHVLAAVSNGTNGSPLIVSLRLESSLTRSLSYGQGEPDRWTRHGRHVYDSGERNK